MEFAPLGEIELLTANRVEAGVNVAERRARELKPFPVFIRRLEPEVPRREQVGVRVVHVQLLLISEGQDFATAGVCQRNAVDNLRLYAFIDLLRPNLREVAPSLQFLGHGSSPFHVQKRHRPLRMPLTN